MPCQAASAPRHPHRKEDAAPNHRIAVGLIIVAGRLATGKNPVRPRPSCLRRMLSGVEFLDARDARPHTRLRGVTNPSGLRPAHLEPQVSVCPARQISPLIFFDWMAGQGRSTCTPSFGSAPPGGGASCSPS